uniref:Uncharacterized protein n=1 Tax=Arundo donax TaxID=35708 RepID=A0A0A9AAU2_ARUDO
MAEAVASAAGHAMEASTSATPGQVSAILGFLWVFAAWAYAEVLFHRKNAASIKTHSDVNLAVMDSISVKGEDKKTVIGGGWSSSSCEASLCFPHITIAQAFLHGPDTSSGEPFNTESNI